MNGPRLPRKKGLRNWSLLNHSEMSMLEEKERIEKKVEVYHQQMVDMLCELIAIPFLTVVISLLMPMALAFLKSHTGWRNM